MALKRTIMTYANHPPTLYDEIIEDRDYCRHKGTNIPIRTSAIDEIASRSGQSEIQLDRPDGTTHTLTGDDPIPPREELLDDLLAAQQAFEDRPVATLNNLSGGRLGPLHYTDTSAHFTVGTDIFDARPQRGTGPIPEEFTSLGVKAAHLCEGFKISNNLQHHWIADIGWEITASEQYRAAMEDAQIPEDRSPPEEKAFIINVPSVFPGQSFGQCTDAPAEVVNHAISKTENLLHKTLLTKRMAQLKALEQSHKMLAGEMDRGNVEMRELADVETVCEKSFNISASGVASLQSQMKDRRRKAFQTVRRLSTSEDFNYVMEEFAETIDELGELAMLGTRYREEVLDEPPGFY